MKPKATDGRVDRPVDGTRNGRPRRDRGEILDVMPPAAVESERALLSAVMVAGSIDRSVTLPAHEFYDERNQAVWSAIVTWTRNTARSTRRPSVPR